MTVTLITGGSTGIGAATARALLAAGHRVAVTGRDAGRLAEFTASVTRDAAASATAEGAAGGTAATAADRLLTLVSDAGVDADVTAAVAATTKRFGGLTNVVANAGYSTHDTLADGDPEQWREMVLANVLGPMLLIRAALPHLRAAAVAGDSPRVVLVGSVAGLRNSPGNVYSVTKWAVTGLAENARLLVTGDGIGVTLVAPGRVDTGFWDSRAGGRPAGPAIGPDDIARTIAWTLAQPPGMDVNTVVVRPLGQTI